MRQPGTGQIDDAKMRKAVAAALGCIPGGVYLLTAASEDQRAGMIAHWVQRVCHDPPMVSIAVAKGQAIMPLISESRRFAICQLGEPDRMTLRKFGPDAEPSDDPFLGMDLVPGDPAAPPVPAHTVAFVECELACHLDVEGDHDLFVGRVKRGALHGGEPKVMLNADEPVI